MSIEEPVVVTNKRKSSTDKTPEERAAKKARKEARALKRASKTSAPSVDAPAPAPAASVTDDDAVAVYLKENEISYEPKDALKTFPPFLDFASVPVADDLRPALASFTKPTPVQAAAFGVLFRKSKDTIGIAETG
jgi:hypothetical protein